MSSQYVRPEIQEVGAAEQFTKGLPYAIKYEEDAFTMIWDNAQPSEPAREPYSSPVTEAAGDGVQVTRGYWYGNKLEEDAYTMIWDQFTE